MVKADAASKPGAEWPGVVPSDGSLTFAVTGSTGPIVNDSRARQYRCFSYGDYVEPGGLMSYGPNYADLFKRAADMVDKILHETKAGDIPVEHPTKFDFAINVNTRSRSAS